MHELGLHLICFVKKKTFTELKAYKIADLLTYSLSTFFDYQIELQHE